MTQTGTRNVHTGKKCPHRQVVSIQLQTGVQGWDKQCPHRQEVPTQKTSSVNSATDKKCPRLGQAVSTKARSAHTDKCQFSIGQEVSKAGTSSVHKGKKCPHRQVVSIQLQTRSVQGWDKQCPHRQEVPTQTISVNSATDKKCQRLGQALSTQARSAHTDKCQSHQTRSVQGWDKQCPQRQEVPTQTSSVNSATYKKCPRLGQAVSTQAKSAHTDKCQFKWKGEWTQLDKFNTLSSSGKSQHL